MLKHHTAYNSLVHDVLGMRLNRVSNLEGKKLDVETADPFWLNNAGLAFPAVADHVDQALNDYRQEKERILRSTGVNVEADPAEISTAEAGDSAVGRLRLALNVVPELTERKRIIDCHFQLCCAILERIKQRSLGDLLLVEQNPTEQSVLAAIKATGGRVEDKLRLFLCYYLSLPSSTQNPDTSMFEAALQQAGCKLDAVGWAKRTRSLRSFSAAPQAKVTVQPLNAEDDLINRFKQFGPSTLGGMFTSMVSGVKALLPESTDIPLVKQVEHALDTALLPGDGKSSNFMIIDPRVKPTANTPQKPGHLIIFLTGGSNYSEYNACQEFMRKRSLKYPVTFGSTDLIGGDEFLEQLARL